MERVLLPARYLFPLLPSLPPVPLLLRFDLAATRNPTTLPQSTIRTDLAAAPAYPPIELRMGSE